jgi:hypothetical protein
MLIAKTRLLHYSCLNFYSLELGLCGANIFIVNLAIPIQKIRR